MARALDSKIDPADAARWTEPILTARAQLASSFDGESLEDIAEPWIPGKFNSNGSLFANVLFGLPTQSVDDTRGYLGLDYVAEVLRSSGARAELEAIGHDIAREFAELVGAVEENSSVLESFQGYPKATILAATEIISASPSQGIESMSEEHREVLLTLACNFVQTRDRLDVLDDARIARLMECQAKARTALAGREDFVFFDEDRFSPGRSVAENILNAKRRFDRKSAWKMLTDRIEEAIRAAGLREELIRLGLSAQAGSNGSNLSASARRRAALVRAMLKGPRFIILDGIAGGNDPADTALRRAIRDELPETCLVFAAADGFAGEADVVISIDDSGNAVAERRTREQPLEAIRSISP